MRQQRVDELARRDHYYLNADDICYYFGEYTARNGKSLSATNELIANLQQPVNRLGPGPDIRKERAIRQAARLFKSAFDPLQLNDITFVPLPQARPKDHPAYDNRIRRMLRSIADGMDVRELLEAVTTRDSGALTGVRLGPELLYANMRLVPTLIAPRPQTIYLVSDVLTTGAQFVAAKRRLNQALPNVPVYGLFVARKLLETDPIPNFDGL